MALIDDAALSSIASLYMTTDLCDDPNAEKICEDNISQALNICPESIEALLQFSNLRILRKRDKEAKEAMYKIYEKLQIRKEIPLTVDLTYLLLKPFRALKLI